MNAVFHAVNSDQNNSVKMCGCALNNYHNDNFDKLL